MSPVSNTSPSLHQTSYPGGKWEPGPARYGHVIEKDVVVPMSDGVSLMASIAYPTDPKTGKRASGRFPVVIEHTPYVNLGRGELQPITYLTDHGYIVAIVWMRGMGKSGGAVDFYGVRDREDGASLVRWAAKDVSGTDGRVALVGCSFPAGHALGDAAAVGPNSPLKAVVASCNAFDSVGRGAWFKNGLPTANYWRFIGSLPAIAGGGDATRAFAKEMGELGRAGTPDGPALDAGFWTDRAPTRLAADVVRNGVPVLLWSGYKDLFPEPVLRSFVAFQNAAAGKPIWDPIGEGRKLSPRYQMLMGDWTHAEGLDIGLYLQWLDTWVKGVDTGLQDSTAPLHLFEGGTGRWVNVARFPITEVYTNFFPNGERLDRQSGAAATASLVYGQPDRGGWMLRFSTGPLPEGATIAGPFSATITAASSNTNMVLIGKLYDVAPDGSETQISEAGMLGSQSTLDDARSWKNASGDVILPWPKQDRDIPLVPGKEERFVLGFIPVVWGIAPGHALRLDLMTANPTTLCKEDGLPTDKAAQTFCGLTDPQKRTVPGGTYTLRLGAEGTVLHLPLLPYKALPAARAGTLPTGWNESAHALAPTDIVYPLDWGTPGAGSPKR